MTAETVATDLERFLELLWEPGDVREVRIPKYSGRRTASGYFDDPAKLIDAVGRWDGRANVYVTLNPVRPALLARAANRINDDATVTTSDADILVRRWLLVDIDPDRPTGISATEEESRAALELARKVRTYLAGLGWPDPVVAMTGNGYAALYRIDLPNDDESTRLVAGVLAPLAGRFDDEAVKVDTTVSNASRIGCLVGTMKKKGDSTPDRPHRRSELIYTPSTIGVVGAELLEALVPPAEPRRESQDTNGRMPAGWVKQMLEAKGITYREHVVGDITWYRLNDGCPFHRDDDIGGDCAVGERIDGMAVGKCLHNRGAGKGWQDFKAELGLEVPRIRLGFGADGHRGEDEQGAGPEPAGPEPAARFTRVNLAEVEATTPDLVLGIAYRGFQAVIAGPTGSAKTMLACGLLLEGLRSGLGVGHWDHEMGESPIAFRYRAMGATDKELARIAYYPWPEPKLADSDAFVAQVQADGSELVLLDPTADFLGAAGLDENVNAEVTRWAAAFPQRLTQVGVTTITIDGMPHAGERQRGASQKGYKAATVWIVEVIDEPSKDHVGTVALTCAKDRFGVVGKGASIVFAVGGDGSGRIVVERQASFDRPPAAERADSDRAQWLGIVVATLERHAPDEAHAISQNQLLGLMPPGKRKDFRRQVIQEAATNPLMPVRVKPGSRGSLVYWYQEPTGSHWDGPGPGQSETESGGPGPRPGPTESGLKGTQSGTQSRDPVEDAAEDAFARYVREASGGTWSKLDERKADA